MTAPVASRRARAGMPLRYAGWQLRDTLLTRGVQALLIGLLLGLQVALPVRLGFGPGWADDPRAAEMLAVVVRSLESLLPSVLTLVAVHGLVSGDRRSGHFRLLFAKPVGVAGYYAQAWLAHLAVLLAVGLLLVGVFGAVVRPVSPGPLLAGLALTFALMGSLGFLLSACTRFDWLLLAALWVGSGLVHSAWAEADGWRAAVRWLLPPTYRLEPVTAALGAGSAPDAAALLHVLGYGALCFALALLVVRRRPLGA